MGIGRGCHEESADRFEVGSIFIESWYKAQESDRG